MLVLEILVLYLMSKIRYSNTFNISENYEDVQAYKSFIRVFNEIPTLSNLPQKAILDVHIDQFLFSNSQEEITAIETEIRNSNSFIQKINCLKCSYGYVILKMLHYLEIVKPFCDSIIKNYNIYIWRMLSVLYIGKITTPPTLLDTAIEISSIREGKSLNRLFDNKIMGNLKSYLCDCIAKFYLPFILTDNLSSVNKFSFISLRKNIEKLLDNLKLIEGNDLEYSGIYRYGPELDIFSFFQNNLNRHKALLPPGQFCKHNFYDQTEFWDVLSECIETVKKKWATNYSAIFQYTKFLKNTLLMIMSFVVLQNCFYIQNVWFEKSKKLYSSPNNIEQLRKSIEDLLQPLMKTINEICQILDIENDQYFKNIETHWKLDKNDTKQNFEHFVLSTLRIHQSNFINLGLKSNPIILKEKNTINSAQEIKNLNLLLDNYKKIFKKCLMPFDFKKINYLQQCFYENYLSF
ncbi:uncharacterized protein LOC126896682 [Daktulosphaira vitifoliae]|uniref:uncharacterized protein LOC126896682 n=1 Tax=Daktulosphaira vitifoliae TaxID=58002 RepID=UPI0021AAB4F7|nr:uncharacterized protein LOC126896682 [Daktulosphaira vitifoliae]